MNLIKIVVLFVLSTTLLSKQYGNIEVDSIVSIYDGDTFRVNIKNYPPIVGNNISIRLNGVDTPEMRAKCEKEKILARKAKKFTVTFLRTSSIIELRNIKRGKYFRIVADVYADNKSLSKALIDNNLAVEYHGGTKTKDWCGQ